MQVRETLASDTKGIWALTQAEMGGGRGGPAARADEWTATETGVGPNPKSPEQVRSGPCLEELTLGPLRGGRPTLQEARPVSPPFLHPLAQGHARETLGIPGPQGQALLTPCPMGIRPGWGAVEGTMGRPGP